MNQIISTHIIIVAAGKGSRMKSDLPKQFMHLNDKPILSHTINTFINALPDANIIVALPPHDDFSDLIAPFIDINKVTLVKGGDTRFHSVKNALNTIKIQNGFVTVHDGVRCLVDADTILRGYTEVQKTGACVPVIDCIDSMRQMINEDNIYVNRNNYKIVQTPQWFNLLLLKNAFEKPFQQNFTDEASVVEDYGHKITLFQGNENNIKITNPKDIELAKIIINRGL